MFGLKKKILQLTLIPLIAVLLVIIIIAIVNKNNTEKQLLLTGSKAYITLLENGDVSFDSIQSKATFESFLNEKVAFIEILKEDLSVVYTSENIANPIITNNQTKNLVNDAFEGTEIIKNTNFNKKPILEIFSPLIVNGRIIAVIHFGIAYEKSNGRVLGYSMFFLILVVSAIIFCYLAISILLKNIILKNIYHLKKIVVEMQQNNLDTPINIKSNDEIGDFAEAFEEMRSKIKESQQKLKGYNQELSAQVEQKTSELKNKINETERINRLMIDRELAMIELKKENKRLLDTLQSTQSQIQ